MDRSLWIAITFLLSVLDAAAYVTSSIFKWRIILSFSCKTASFSTSCLLSSLISAWHSARGMQNVKGIQPKKSWGCVSVGTRTGAELFRYSTRFICWCWWSCLGFEANGFRTIRFEQETDYCCTYRIRRNVLYTTRLTDVFIWVSLLVSNKQQFRHVAK